jgi:photosystem II stability/assembly factor-like uncharacterized protein
MLVVRRCLVSFLLCSVCLPLAAQSVTGSRPTPPRARRKAYLRQQYFHDQRAYPLGFIPQGANLNALRQVKDLIQRRRPKFQVGINGLNGFDYASGTAWTEIGPKPLASGYAAGEVSGRVSALAIDPTNNDVVFLGAGDGGVWKTTDGGSTWNPVTDEMPSLSIGSIAIAASNHNVIYVGTGEGNVIGSGGAAFDAYYGAGILKSTDGGNTWAHIPGPFAGPTNSASHFGGAYIPSIAVKPDNENIVLAGVYMYSAGWKSGIYRSTDGGNNWTQVLLQGTSSSAPAMELYFVDTTTVLASVGNSPSQSAYWGVYKSTDAGATWTKINGTVPNTLPTVNTGRMALAVVPGNANIIYAGVANDSTDGLLGLYKTADGGATWTRLSAPDYCTPQCWYDNVIGVKPDNANVVYVGGAASHYMSRSLDGGLSWTDVQNGNNGASLHVDQHAIAFTRDGTKMYVGNDGGVWSTTNVATTPVSWTNLNHTIGTLQFYPGLAVHPTLISQTVAGTQDNGIERYTGALTWQSVVSCDGGFSAIDPQNPNYMYSECQLGNGPLKTTDGGTTWSWANSGINAGDSGLFIPPLMMDSTNPTNLYYGTYRVWRTTNRSGSWVAISSALVNPSIPITNIAVAPSDSNTVYAITKDAHVFMTSSALADVSGGTLPTWADKSSTTLPIRYPTAIAVSPADKNTAYITFSGFKWGSDSKGHLFKTTDGGTTWTDVSGDLPNTPANDIVIDPDVPNRLYVATDAGVFQTDNGGTNWAVLGTGLPNSAVTSIKLHPATHTLRAATHGRGVWDIVVSGSGGSVTLSPASLDFGGIKPGTTSSARTLTLGNTTGSAVSNISVSITGDYARAGGTCTTALIANSSCTITITFTPVTTGVRNGTATVTLTGAAAPEPVSLTGVGGLPAISLSATGIDPGAVAVGVATLQSLTINNIGTAAVSISEYDVTTQGAEFQIADSPCYTIEAGASCTISLRFSPSASGTRTGTLDIKDDAAGSPRRVMMKGTGRVTTGVLHRAPVAPFQPIYQYIYTTSGVRRVQLSPRVGGQRGLAALRNTKSLRSTSRTAGTPELSRSPNSGR